MNQTLYKWTLRALLTVWALAVIAEAKATEIPISRLDDNATGFVSEKEAVTAALQASSDRSQFDELAGAIVQRLNGLYYFTIPVRGNEEHFIMRLQFQGKLIALYHTHPGNGCEHGFSKEDRRVAKELRTVSYIKVIASGQIFRYSGI